MKDSPCMSTLILSLCVSTLILNQSIFILGSFDWSNMHLSIQLHFHCHFANCSLICSLSLYYHYSHSFVDFITSYDSYHYCINHFYVSLSFHITGQSHWIVCSFFISFGSLFETRCHSTVYHKIDWRLVYSA